jgi:hypothetical protein
LHRMVTAGWAGLVASSILGATTVSPSGGDPGSTPTDLFDVSTGTVVNAGSPVIDGCDLGDILGGTNGSTGGGCEGAGKVIFKDINSGPWPFGPNPPANASNYFITFTTPLQITLSSYSLYLEDDFNLTANRTVSEFRLYVDDGSGNPVTLLSDVVLLGSGQTNYNSVYGNDSIVLSDAFSGVTGSQFSAVFTSNPLAASDSGGPRVFELDGFGDPLEAPEPATLALVGSAMLLIRLSIRLRSSS